MAQEIPGSHLMGEFGQKALIVKEEKVLMCRGIGDTSWDLPGGRLHIGEEPAEGLAREIREELGVEIESHIVPVYVAVWDGAHSKIPRVMVVYRVELKNSQDAFILPPDEIEEVRYVGKEEYENVPMWKGWKKALDIYFKNQ